MASGGVLVEVGSVARVVHSADTAGNDAPHGELPSGLLTPKSARAEAASAIRAERHATWNAVGGCNYRT